MKYAMKSNVYVTAEQWFPGKKISGVYRTFLDNILLKFDHAWLDGQLGKTKVRPGDWIVTDKYGDKYSYTNENFQIYYESLQYQQFNLE